LVPFHWMTEEEMKLDPFTVNVNPEPPATADEGDIELIDGAGFDEED